MIDKPEMLGVNSVTAEAITIRVTAQVKLGANGQSSAHLRARR